MDCYYHKAVPSVAVCTECTRTICPTCRDEQGLCPSCRLERRIDAARAARMGLPGEVGPSYPPPPRAAAAPPPPPGPSYAAPPPPAARAHGTLATASPETRALVALGYPLWPLAALALLNPSRSPDVQRQALQALGFNFGMFGLYVVLQVVGHVPLLGLSAWPILAVLFPVWFVASVVFGIKAWNGDDVRVPLVSDWLDARESRPQNV